MVYQRDPRGNANVALDGLRRAIDISNNCDKAHYYMGMIAKQADEPSKAELYFSRAVAANSNNFEASRELRLLERRSTSSSDPAVKKSFLSGLFGRKKS